MIDQTSILPTTPIDYSYFHPGVTTTRVDAGERDSRAPLEQIVADHTAIQPSRRLSAAYAFQSAMTGLPLLAVDLLVTAAGLLAATVIVNAAAGRALEFGLGVQLPVLLVLQTVMMFLHQLYPGAGVSKVAELRGTTRSTVIAIACLSALNVTLGQLPRIEFFVFVLTGICVTIALPMARWATRHVLSRTNWWGIRVLLIGRRDDCLAILRQLSQRRASGYNPGGYTCDPADAQEYGFADSRLMGVNADAASVARAKLIPVAGLVSPDHESRSADRMVFQFPSIVWVDGASAARNDLDVSSLPQVFIRQTDTPFLRFLPRLCKRALDLAIVIPGLLALAIPMGVIALAIKYFSPGPVIYGSRRVGQHGKSFMMWKFRSMVPNADAVLEQKLESDPEARAEWERDAKLKSDPRIIPGIGHALRRYSLDELPQLWNVLVGEMSLVGPRPMPHSEIVRYQKHFYEYTQMWPGMTGLWQVSGRNDTTFETRVFLVRHYARTWSPWLDFWLLLNTPSVVITRSGAY